MYPSKAVKYYDAVDELIRGHSLHLNEWDIQQNTSLGVRLQVSCCLFPVDRDYKLMRYIRLFTQYFTHAIKHYGQHLAIYVHALSMYVFSLKSLKFHHEMGKNTVIWLYKTSPTENLPTVLQLTEVKYFILSKTLKFMF